MKTKFILAAFLVISVAAMAKKPKIEKFSVENYGKNNAGTELQIRFERGTEHNYPLFAVWLADDEGNYIQTLYVSQSIGKGVFKRISRSKGGWMPGEIQRPAALPYWAHQRNEKNENGGVLPTPKNPVPDAYTGATPTTSYVLNVKTEQTLSGNYKIMLELNQSWDWNEAWFNARFPDEKEYKTSSQPALIYAAEINSENKGVEVPLKPIGHAHYAGKDGSLTTDLSTLTTALKIAKKITVKVN